MWEKSSYPSLRSLGPWVRNLLDRGRQLMDWTADTQLPKVTWISGLFNPQSFLTAVMQTTARRQDWPLDRTMIQTDVTKKLTPDDVSVRMHMCAHTRMQARTHTHCLQGPSKDGALIFGLDLEGARWDDKSGSACAHACAQARTHARTHTHRATSKSASRACCMRQCR